MDRYTDILLVKLAELEKRIADMEEREKSRVEKTHKFKNSLLELKETK